MAECKLPSGYHWPQSWEEKPITGSCRQIGAGSSIHTQAWDHMGVLRVTASRHLFSCRTYWEQRQGQKCAIQLQSVIFWLFDSHHNIYFWSLMKHLNSVSWVFISKCSPLDPGLTSPITHGGQVVSRRSPLLLFCLLQIKPTTLAANVLHSSDVYPARLPSPSPWAYMV